MCDGTSILNLLNNKLYHLALLLCFTRVALNIVSVHIYSSTYFFYSFIAAYCSPPNNPINGTVHSLTGTKLGNTLRFSCDQGFRLIGQSSATCTRTAQGIHQWNAPVPLCQGKTQSQSRFIEDNTQTKKKRSHLIETNWFGEMSWARIISHCAINMYKNFSYVSSCSVCLILFCLSFLVPRFRNDKIKRSVASNHICCKSIQMGLKVFFFPS